MAEHDGGVLYHGRVKRGFLPCRRGRCKGQYPVDSDNFIDSNHPIHIGFSKLQNPLGECHAESSVARTERPLEPDPDHTGVGKRRNGTFGTAAPRISGVAVFVFENRRQTCQT
jgi:hypothetical protein